MSSQENNNNSSNGSRDIKSEIVKKRSSWIGTAVVMVIIIAILWYIVSTFFLAKSQDDALAGQAMRQQQVPSVVLYIVEDVDLSISREYMGKVEPVQSVAVRPQVSGVITDVRFKEGSRVKAGDLLFGIDNRQFAAAVDLRKADLARAEANYDRAAKYRARLASSDSRSIPAVDVDMAENDVLQCRAAIQQAKASLRLAELDLGYTKITAPIAGRIGKAFFTKGNYVSPAGGPLAEIVQTDPIRVVFAMPDKDYLERMDDFKKSGNRVFNTSIRLANGIVYPQNGERDFEENSMNESTGTITMRLRFDNGDGTLVPGAVVRVQATPAARRTGPVIPQEAVLADPEGDYVYVVDESNVAHQRRVTLGPEVGSMCEVVSGLASGDRVVRRGIQSVRPEGPVNPAPQRSGDAAKTPAELAMESGYDLKGVDGTPVEGSSGASESAEGDN
ncbi:MAG: efflux RND transporter periplasmic adaptor subunit [Synergistaceae bacterium]|jgi:RND family efflux transporter MFP subunit|nr:efflux RND transporter periplasmic adaptor subunit [Synergistaceae bacterium]